MRFAVRSLALSACLVAAASACSQGGQAPEFSPQQQARGRIIQAFERDPSSALRKYREIWRSGRNDPARRIEMLTIAGELAENDPANAAVYFAGLREGTGSSSTEERLVAIDALGKVKGRQAIDLLVGFTQSDDPYLAEEAMRALNYRLATAYDDAASAGDKRYIEQRLPQLCSNAYRAEIEQFCDRR
jgi:HEAT repeat protein